MTFKYTFKASDMTEIHKLNGLANFHCKIHRFLDWGILITTKDGINILTLTDNQKNSFSLKENDLVVIYDNKVWFPFSSFNENTPFVEFGQFRVNHIVQPMLCYNRPGSTEELFSSVSAVHAYTQQEMILRPELAIFQRQKFNRYIRTGQKIRNRVRLNELTAVDTKRLYLFVQDYIKAGVPEYYFLSHSAHTDLHFAVRILFTQLQSNALLELGWKEHKWCALNYTRFGKYGILYNEHFAIVDVPVQSREAGKLNLALKDALLSGALLERMELPQDRDIHFNLGTFCFDDPILCKNS